MSTTGGHTAAGRLRQGTAPPNFETVPDLNAHYRAVRARIWGATPAPQSDAPPRPSAAPKRASPPATVPADAPLTTEGKRIRQTIAQVARFHGIHPAQFKGPDRSRRITHARWDAIVALWFGFPRLTQVQIARAIGLRDHSCVMHALRVREIAGTGGETMRRHSR